jgi:hypothetical protein
LAQRANSPCCQRQQKTIVGVTNKLRDSVLSIRHSPWRATVRSFSSTSWWLQALKRLACVKDVDVSRSLECARVMPCTPAPVRVPMVAGASAPCLRAWAGSMPATSLVIHGEVPDAGSSPDARGPRPGWVWACGSVAGARRRSATGRSHGDAAGADVAYNAAVYAAGDGPGDRPSGPPGATDNRHYRLASGGALPPRRSAADVAGNAAETPQGSADRAAGHAA